MIRKILLTLVLIFALVIMGCSDSESEKEDDATSMDSVNIEAVAADSEPGSSETLTFKLHDGAEVFMGLEPEILRLDIENQGQIVQMDFVGVSLDAVLENRPDYKNKAYSKVELVVSDMSPNMDITEMAKADAGVFLAWSESGVPETPFRVFPKDAGTANLLTGNVTEIIITK
jgi:hypothetical protein